MSERATPDDADADADDNDDEVDYIMLANPDVLVARVDMAFAVERMFREVMLQYAQYIESGIDIYSMQATDGFATAWKSLAKHETPKFAAEHSLRAIIKKLKLGAEEEEMLTRALIRLMAVWVYAIDEKEPHSGRAS